MIKVGIAVIVASFLFFSCKSEEEELAEKICACLEQDYGDLDNCMSEKDLKKLEEYDKNREKEESLMKLVKEKCSDAAGENPHL